MANYCLIFNGSRGRCKEKISIFKTMVDQIMKKIVFSISEDVRIFTIFENRSLLLFQRKNILEKGKTER